MLERATVRGPAVIGAGARLILVDAFAAGLSLILHPRNPRVPTVHANWRFIQQGGKAWFGGGADLIEFVAACLEQPHDVAFAQGYVTAQDRLWQMDALRRYAAAGVDIDEGDALVDDLGPREIAVGSVRMRNSPHFAICADEIHVF